MGERNEGIVRRSAGAWWETTCRAPVLIFAGQRDRGATKMNLRERFHEVMHFNTNVRTIKWEFGYWGETINKWYDQGLPRRKPPAIPRNPSTPTSHLYSLAWNSLGGARLPKGIAVIGGGLYWPTQGMPLDNDVRESFGLDKAQIMTNVNLLFCPMFEQVKIAEDENYFDYIDSDGVTRRFMKNDQTMPSGLDYPIKDRKTWEKLKRERLNLEKIKDRFPKNWVSLVKSYKNRDYPLALGGYPHGLFGTLADLMGYETLFLTYHDDPGLIHDIQKTFTELWIAVFSEVLQYTSIDHMHFWEDISYGSGCMVSNDIMREFMLPYYKRITDFLRSKGVDIILLDTDGYCMDIIDLFLEGGITGMYPFERHCGMDIVEVRKKYPHLQIMGGIPKEDIRKGEKRIEEILEPAKAVLKTGGYIPHADHLIPPENDYASFSYYRRRLNELIESAGKS